MSLSITKKSYKILSKSTSAKKFKRLSSTLKICASTTIALTILSSIAITTPVDTVTWTVDVNDKTFLTGTNTITLGSGKTLLKNGNGLGVITGSQGNINSSAIVDVAAGTLQINSAGSLGTTNSGAQLILEAGSSFAIGSNITVPNNIQIGKDTTNGTASISGISYDTNGTTVLTVTNITFTGVFTQGGTSTTQLLVGNVGEDARNFIFSGNNFNNVGIIANYGVTSFDGTSNAGTLRINGGSNVSFGNSNTSIPTTITIADGQLTNNANDFANTTIKLQAGSTSFLDIKNANVVINGFGALSSGNLKIFSSITRTDNKSVNINGANADLTGTVTLYDGITIAGHTFPTLTDPTVIVTLKLPYNYGTAYNLLDNNYLFTPQSGTFPYTNASIDNDGDAVVASGANITYTPGATFHGSATLTYKLADTRFIADTGTIGTPGETSYLLSSDNKTVSIAVAPPSDLNGGNITLADDDFVTFGGNLGSFPIGEGNAATFTNTSTNTASTLTINLSGANRSLASTITHTADKNNTNVVVSGDKTLTLAAGNTYVGTTSISAGATLIGDISTSSAVTINGTYDLHDADRVLNNISGNGTVISSNANKSLSLSITTDCEFTGTFNETQITSISKTGAQTLTLNSASITAPLTINAGGLILNNSLVPGTAALNFSVGTSFQAKGTAVLTNAITFG